MRLMIQEDGAELKRSHSSRQMLRDEWEPTFRYSATRCRLPASGYELRVASLELETVAEFGEDFAGVVVVEAAEGEAVVKQHAAVGGVGCGDRGGEVFAEAFADGNVEGSVLGQVGVGKWGGGVGRAVYEAGAVVDVGGG